MNDIAICGLDTRFCRMLELELRAMGYTVVRQPHGGVFRLWIVDLDTVSPEAGHDGRIYLGVTHKQDTAVCDPDHLCVKICHRPLRMREFREEITHLLSPDAQPSRNVTALPQPHLLRTPRGFELDGKVISLTATEETVLCALYDRRGQTVTRAELCALLGNESNDKLADVYICLVRRKLEHPGVPRLLLTVRGVGYRLEAET